MQVLRRVRLSSAYVELRPSGNSTPAVEAFKDLEAAVAKANSEGLRVLSMVELETSRSMPHEPFFHQVLTEVALLCEKV